MVEDYIERQIDQLGKALRKWLSKIILLREQGKESHWVENSIQSELNLDFSEIILQDKADVIPFLQKRMIDRNLEAVAEIMIELAKFDLADSDKAERRNRTALTILEYLEKTSATFSLSRKAKIEELKKSISINL